MSTPLAFLPKIRSEMIMQSAKGQPCSLRLTTFVPGMVCSGTETTVGCHLPVLGKGTGTKVTDIAMAYGCSRCHGLLDMVHEQGFLIKDRHPGPYWRQLLNAMAETQMRLVEQELIIVPDMEII